MNITSQKWRFFPLVLLKLAFFFLTISCQSAPPHNEDDPPVGVAQQPPPPQQVLGQAELDRLDAAITRATDSREGAIAVRASVHFPDEWAQAESNYEAGRGAGRATLDAVNQAIASFTAAADLYDTIAANSAPLFAGEMEVSRQALEAAMTRARRSRQDAMDNQGQTHFARDWRTAESRFQSGENTETDTLDGVQTASALFVAAADDFDSIAARSRPLVAQARENAQRDMQAALTRAEQSRRDAQANRANTHFPAEWRDAEAQLRTGRDARRGTPDEMRAAADILTALAATYDDLAARSRPLFERDEAQRALNAAITRVDRSRRAAANAGGETFLPNEWRAADSRNQAGVNAPRDTAAQVQAATAMFVEAADGFDDIARRSGPMQTAARNEANAALQAATARADTSRQAAIVAEGQTRLPDEWREAEAQNQAARRGRRTTLDEVRTATAQLNSAADSFDRIAQRSGPMAARERTQAENALRAAITRAERSRQAAISAEGQANFPADWRSAEAQNTAANRARTDTVAEMQTATGLFVTAADSFDDIARRSGPIAAAARNDANRDFQAALTRANASRQAAVAADGQAQFPNEWGRAESQNTAGRNAPRNTVSETRAATTQLNSAADGFDNIAQRAAVARERGEADGALQTAIARAERSRQAAIDADGQALMPDEWREAESRNTAANRARRTNVQEIRAATELFVAAANSFDDIARRSGPMAAAARNQANRDFQAAAGRADRSRRAAVAVEGESHFPRDWERAESQNTAGRSAPRTTVGETMAATAQLNSAADGFDSIAERSGPLFAGARDQANTALQAAMARADSSRQAAMAVEAQTFFPADWRTADSQNTAARRARRNTPEEMRNATTMFVAAADGFDDLARRSGPMFAADRNEADSALQSAMTRATQSRQRAENTDAATNLPRDWRNLETRHRNAENARRGTLAEIRNAANLFNGVADAFDDIVQRNIRFAEENQAAALAARTAAERERQVAIDARANVAARDDFNRADATFQQALTDFNARNFAAARTQYNQSANQFIASVREADRRRRLADVTVEEARRRSAESTAFAISTGLALEEEEEGET